MTQELWTELLKYLVPSVLTFIIGFLFSQFRRFNGYILILKWVSRRLIIEDCKFYIQQGFMTPQESSDLDKLWKVYHKYLKMNTEGETYYNLAKKLPVKLKEEDK